MTICPKYSDMRARFAQLFAATAPDGWPYFPGPWNHAGGAAQGAFNNNGTSLLRANGFASSWTVTTAHGHVWNSTLVGSVGPLIAGTVPGGDPLFPLTITINGGAADASPGNDAYNWYLSARSDGTRQPLPNGQGLSPTAQLQYLQITHPTDRLHSGTVIVSVSSAQAVAALFNNNGIPPTDSSSLATLFNGCALYVSRISDKAYQWARFV